MRPGFFIRIRRTYFATRSFESDVPIELNAAMI
jgi:hypothetical protein